MSNLRNESREFGLSHDKSQSEAVDVSTATPAGARNETGEFGVSGQDEPVEPGRPEGYVGQTGPKTMWGKAKSSQNAVKHGLCAQAAIIDGEDPAELAALHAEFLADEKPQTAMERMLIEQIVMAGWKLRRASRYEGQLLKAKLATIRRQRAHNTRHGSVTIRQAHGKQDERAEAELDMPRAVDLMLQGKSHWQMTRYGNGITREMYKAMGELRKVQKERAKSTHDQVHTSKVPCPHAQRVGMPEANEHAHLPTSRDEGMPPSAGMCETISPDGERVRWVRVADPPNPYAARDRRIKQRRNKNKKR